jgi:hypothetical protein
VNAEIPSVRRGESTDKPRATVPVAVDSYCISPYGSILYMRPLSAIRCEWLLKSRSPSLTPLLALMIQYPFGESHTLTDRTLCKRCQWQVVTLADGSPEMCSYVW